MNNKPLIYIAGPYTKGDVELNVRNALAMAEKVIQKGGLPFVPHLSHFWHLTFPKALQWWYAYDIQLLKRCDGLVRLMGESEGADQEVVIAIDLRIPVYPASEVWHEDFMFPSKATFQSDAKLAARGTRFLPPCFER